MTLFDTAFDALDWISDTFPERSFGTISAALLFCACTYLLMNSLRRLSQRLFRKLPYGSSTATLNAAPGLHTAPVSVPNGFDAKPSRSNALPVKADAVKAQAAVAAGTRGGAGEDEGNAEPASDGSSGWTSSEESSDDSSDSGECKMVLVVRQDLQMGKGKIAAQCCHATLGAYKKAVQCKNPFLQKWERSGQAKVALKCSDDEELKQLRLHARAKGVHTYLVADAGRTQIAAGSHTVLAIGPAPVKAIDEIARHLKLL
eukprot:GDKH01017917.1.p1 GENE.GDKH01017917.1~~GDKH01017917.1.p1  ORF type:complete len:259 (+),score=26.13 GDKH01017917.1:130-906(+)